MSLVQTKIQLSRKLLIILTPGASAEKSSDSPEAYDLQVGLHQALVQGETGVILIQLGQMQDYTHLPLGLQHLLCKNSPPAVGRWRILTKLQVLETSAISNACCVVLSEESCEE